MDLGNSESACIYVWVWFKLENEVRLRERGGGGRAEERDKFANYVEQRQKVQGTFSSFQLNQTSWMSSSYEMTEWCLHVFALNKNEMHTQPIYKIDDSPMWALYYYRYPFGLICTITGWNNTFSCIAFFFDVWCKLCILNVSKTRISSVLFWFHWWNLRVIGIGFHNSQQICSWFWCVVWYLR